MFKIWHTIIIFSILFFKVGFSQDKGKIVTLPEIRVKATTEVNQRLYDAFRKSFPDAENLAWYKYDRDYLAKFIVKDMNHNTLFRQKGSIVYDISYGYEWNLPEETKEIVNRNYDNYKIIRAINIKASGRSIWIVKLEGMKKYITLRIEDQEIDEIESYFKA
ncbi:MAG: hypothetical protein RLY11_1767 [Bacteroidota bacterium]|jgi:hypothetical protein|nr:hypothetical protein [Chitinophagia bacterium]